jgi:enterochelin esterase-like enzyme
MKKDIKLPIIIFWSLVAGTTPSLAEGEAQPGWVTAPVRAPRVEFRTFPSAAAKTNVSYHIYTPDAYATEPQRRFPVVYWLHGSGGGALGLPLLSAFFDHAIREGKLQPLLIVFPNGHSSSMWCDSKDGTVPMETVVVNDLVPHIDATYRTLASREARLLEGFSMGGYGAARLGFKHPDVFGAVSIFAGGPLDLEFKGPRALANPADRERIMKAVYGDDLEYFKAQSPWVLAEKNTAALRGKVRLRIAAGGADSTTALNRKLYQHLQELGIPCAFTVVPGVSHQPLALLKGLGDGYWDFYRPAFGMKSASESPLGSRRTNAAPATAEQRKP